MPFEEEDTCHMRGRIHAQRYVSYEESSDGTCYMRGRIHAQKQNSYLLPPVMGRQKEGGGYNAI
jgi:hypothetical protein